MRTLVTPLVLLLALLVPASAPADVIYLKNGRKIWADQVREEGPRVEYNVGDNSYAIPKASVARIEAGGAPPEYASPRTPEKIDPPNLPEVADDSRTDPGLADEVIKDGRVDPDALASVEQKGRPTASASAYFFAGKYEYDHGNLDQARRYLETALRYDPQNPTVLNYFAVLLVRTGNAQEGLGYAEQAVRAAPNSPDTLAILGYAQFATSHTKEAIQNWKKSLQLRPDANVQQMLAKAEREASAEANFTERESNHFTLRYEGNQTSEAFRRQLIATLEADYDDLVRSLGFAPRNNITVVLYTGQAFFDVTQAPSWSGAINDGKLRIPVEGLSSVTSELARVLKHELAHSFINQLSGGRCPQWLHEGIAQALEPKSLSSNGRRLAQLFATQHAIPFNMLESSFMRFTAIEAVLAYDESLATVQYIIDTYGVSEIQRILERMAQGSSTEAALRSTIHSDYGKLESEVGKYLADKYGT